MTSKRFKKETERLMKQMIKALNETDWESVRNYSQAMLALDAENLTAANFLAAAERGLSAPPPSQSVQSSIVAAAVPPLADPASSPSLIPSPAPRSVQSTSFGDGRYQIKHLLGEGGKKKVYLAHDTLLDREVAFAFIKSEGLDEESRLRIQREAQAMGRLGSHPNIVTIFDLGEHQGQPYMITELMGGGDLEGLIARAPGHQLPISQVLEITKAVCKALEFAHSHGIVHRDLKPGNVWLTTDGLAKIGDFGLSVALDRSRLTLQNMMVGTLYYMPPEQAKGDEVTAKADLYSLGCTVYEMIVGRPPFLANDMAAIIEQHINSHPSPPSKHNSQCPKLLDTLVLRLLAKTPAERPASARDVLAKLEGNFDDGSAEARSTPQAHPWAQEILSEGTYIGRQRETGELKGILEEAISGHGRVVTLAGEPGIGKTRTAEELSNYARLRQMQVLWGRCYEGEGAPPYWPWIQSIRSFARDTDPEQLRSLMGAGAVEIAEIVSEVRYRLQDLPSAPSLGPEQARFRLFDSIVNFLRNAGSKQPLMLILEDLHWADQPTLSLLAFMAKEISSARLLLVGTYRDDGLSHFNPLSQTLGMLEAEEAYQKVQLKGFSREEVGRFIEVATGIVPPPELVATVHGRTDGNPLFVKEVVELLTQEGEFTAEGSRENQNWNVRIPEGTMQVIRRRLDPLSQPCRETLIIASLMGREFSLEQIQRLIGNVSIELLMVVVEEAVAARVIEGIPEAQDRYQFTHAGVQETLAGTLSDTGRAQLHAHIAAMLEGLYADDAQAHLAELAYHFTQAEPILGKEKLILYSRLAGKRAAATHAHQEALTFFQRALVAKEGQEMDEETAELLAGLSGAQAATVQRPQLGEAASNLRRAFEYYVESGEVNRAVSVVESFLSSLFVVPASVAPLITRAMSLVPPVSSQGGRLQSFYGRLLGMEIGDYDAAQKAFENALDIARLEDNEALEMWTSVAAASVDLFHLHFQPSLVRSLGAIKLARGAEELVAEVDARYCAAITLAFTGISEQAHIHAEAGLAQAEILRDRFWLASALWASELVSELSGQWNVARDFSDRGLSAASSDSRLLATRMLMEFETGDQTRAEGYLERLLESMSQTPPRQTLEYVLPALAISMAARVTGALDHLAVAESAAEEVLSLPSPTPLIAMISSASLGLAAIQRGNRVEVLRQYAKLEGGTDTILLGGIVSLDRVRGLLSQAGGRLEDAMAHFEAALSFCRPASQREYAWVCHDYS